jgi:thiol-disulfide isomerase/thioredoxin
MLRTMLMITPVITALVFAGCQQEADTPADGTPAEVPGPGPAADPGPAPADQWEPAVEETPAPDATDTPQTEDDSATSQGATTPKGSEGEEVSLRIQAWDETAKLISDHRGKVVVVDFWSTSCLPCRREFPHLVELQKSNPNDVACVSVSMDYSGRASRPPESYRDQVTEFLAEQDATFENVLISDDPDELQARLELAPIPLVWVFDRQGKLARQFDNSDPNKDEFTYAGDIAPFVASLLEDN